MVLRRRGGRKAPMRKRRGLRGGKRNWRSKRNANNVGGPNTAKVVETMTTIELNENTGYRIQKLGITGPRATAVAPNFGLYRIAKLIFTYKPYYDTFASDNAAIGSNPIRVPYLYWKMNRYADAPVNFTAQYLRTQGSKGIRFDDKNIVVAYKPNVLLQQSAAGSVGSQVKMTPWLSTDARPDDGVFQLSTTEHMGHIFFIEGAASGTGTGPVGTLDVQVVYEFKNPRAPDSVSTEAPVVSQPLAI